tara:strand:- start:111 stop:980 length:870 start_codon:yes stop_codon:yes gene_type:complete
MKTALLFGCNYSNDEKAKLRGCINDVRNVSNYLMNSLDYTVNVFTDEMPGKHTTASGILGHIHKLATDTWKQESNITNVWIHFSGHGCQINDISGDEEDGMDECIVPSDYKRSGVISDDSIYEALNCFHPDTNVMVFFDCCHSGSICDLPYVYSGKMVTEKKIKRTSTRMKMMSNIVMISGCRDNQTSADAFDVNKKQMWSGAMTSCLLTVLEDKNPSNLFNLLELIRYELILKNKGFTQLPMMSSSFDLNDGFNGDISFFKTAPEYDIYTSTNTKNKFTKLITDIGPR